MNTVFLYSILTSQSPRKSASKIMLLTFQGEKKRTTNRLGSALAKASTS
jgi:hypothetical protein